MADMMSALMSDLIEESMSPKIANAVVSASKQLIRVAELQLRVRGRFRTSGDGGNGTDEDTFKLLDEK